MLIIAYIVFVGVGLGICGLIMDRVLNHSRKVTR
jgi:hypothetical protein